MRKKIILTESDLIKVVNKVLSEQKQFLSKLFGGSVDDIIKYFGDDASKSLDDVFAKLYSNSKNIVTSPKGTFIKSASGTEVPMDTVKEAILLVGQGKLSPEQVLQYIPRQLADGTEFRSAIQKAMSNKTSLSNVQNKLQLSQATIKFGEDIRNFNTWIPTSKHVGNLSGWKFHVYSDTFDDVLFLHEKLTPIAKKYGAEMKIAGGELIDYLSSSSLQKGKGVTIYVPSDTVRNKKQVELFSEIENAIQGYNKKGNISGDRMLTNNIGLRYEFSKPINSSIGVDDQQYRALYSKNSGGPYNLQGNPDLFDYK